MSGIFCSLQQVSVTYGRGSSGAAALDRIDLDIVAGERLAIIGESGSGKSTLARALAGLLPEGTRVGGEILWPGLGHPPRPGRDFGLVFQDPGSSLNPVLTIGEQIAEGARRHLGLSWKQAYVRAEELLERVGIPQPDKAMRAFPHQLSGGQRQRVAIAAAIAARPALLIADEATSALDVVVQAEIVRLLDGLVREDGMTLLFITHDIALASGFVDRIAVFRNARLVEAGPVRSVLSAPKSDYTAALIASHRDLATPPLIAEVPS
ncbi:ABC transporter ATP-binding protein [Rhizobium leguminosarum]|uniref:ABC transporter ATP-binding protein n=1 Tax=Rhizobium leguminosarum TaxID=384 RepID=UPI001441119D|nr:ABC transporter ATP-binding protein [Rhizobium leguminosarum]MBY5868195.1 ABC transporter ATP-binding protein [Rhizobium leguminosarum]NKM06660.1 ATP-binding cassette domain-containing protein [Rhizobium leguminosarum bv. viciae]